MRNHKSLIGLVLASALGVGVAAEQPRTATLVPSSASVKFAAAWRPAEASGETMVIGTVIDIRQAPVKDATVQLRDLATGRVHPKTTTNTRGEYTFIVADPSTYVAEMTLDDGVVVALSNAGTLARYETLQTLIQLAGLWDAANRKLIVVTHPASFLGMSSAATMTAATLEFATLNHIPSTNPGEPVSP